MATHGTVTAFDPSKEDWTCYTDRMKHYFIANEVADAGKKRSILLSACGATTFKIIRNLVGDDKLDSTSYDEIVKLVKGYHDPKPSVIVQRYKLLAEKDLTYDKALELALAMESAERHSSHSVDTKSTGGAPQHGEAVRQEPEKANATPGCSGTTVLFQVFRRTSGRQR